MPCLGTEISVKRIAFRIQ